MKQSNQLYFAGLAIILDALTFAAAQYFVPRLIPMMSAPDGMNALLIAGTFFLFAIGVLFFRRMKAAPTGSTEWLTRGQRSALALSFAFVVSLTLAWQLGFFESASQVDTTQMGEGGSASYFVFGPGAWLAFSLIYVLVFAFNVEPTYEYGRRGYWIAALTGLVLTAVLLVVLVAQANVIALAIGAAWWPFLAFLLLGLMFLPSRLLYLSRTTGLHSPAAYGVIVVFGLLLAAFAVQIAG